MSKPKRSALSFLTPGRAFAPEGDEPKAPKPPAFYKRRQRRANEICQILIRHGDVSVEDVRLGLRKQEEHGGQIGQILVRMGAISEEALARALLAQLRESRNAAAHVPEARESPIAGLTVECSPRRTVATLLLADLFSLGFACSLSLALVWLNTHELFFQDVLRVLPVIGLPMAAFAALGLYAVQPHSPSEKLRNTTLSISLVIAGVGAMAIIGKRATHVWTPWSLSLVWVFAVFLVPIVRGQVRRHFARRAWWGHPVVVLGAGKTGRMLVRTLRKHPEFGLKPVCLLDDDPKKQGTLRATFGEEEEDLKLQSLPRIPIATNAIDDVDDLDAPLRQAEDEIPGVVLPKARARFSEVEGVPVLGALELAPILARRLKIPYAIVAMPGVSSRKLLHLTEKVGGLFSHILVIPDLFGFASLGVPAKDIGGVLGIEVRQQLLLPWPRLMKRLMDVSLTLIGGLFISPILIGLALLIKLDSSGPILYWQERLGRDGGRFRAAKFRSMYGDGEARLKAVLESDPKLKAEYEEFHKLSTDPRVTRIGRILRKFSLDELPQLWNVLRGDMSLVGPRPYLEREIPDMNQQETIILRAMPGMTGLWQVGDRNTTGFAERLRTDVHYVRNWSPWLDIYILARTFGVVIQGTGS
jgi:exopolysaccharide biosynthesis polyprenyl glycosylphosphotransferase